MDATKSPSCVVYFDGDDVGARIELLLLRDDIEGAAEVSSLVTSAIEVLAQTLRSRFNGVVKFAAGDEVLAVLAMLPTKPEIDELRSRFAQQTGLTISCGVGFDSNQAATNLRYAKLLGKNLTHHAAPA